MRIASTLFIAVVSILPAVFANGAEDGAGGPVFVADPNGAARSEKVAEYRAEPDSPLGGWLSDRAPEALRMAETDEYGAVIDPSVPFQADPGEDGAWELAWLMTGETPADRIRRYALLGDGGERAAAEPLMRAGDGVMHEGQESIRIETPSGVYYYHKRGAGFASLDDADGNDWISYNPGVGPESESGSGGMYRGIPNSGYPEGYCHPGKEVSSSRLVRNGPVKISILSESDDGKMRCRWDIFPTHARMTLTEMRPPYWFLYEGTPGGRLDMDTDLCVRPGPDGPLVTPVSEKWDGDLYAPDGEGEWLYFADGNRILFLINHMDDEAIDSYWPMNREMTVFGFGRLGLLKYMDRTPAVFSFGLADAGDFASARNAVRNAGIELDVSVTFSFK